MQGAIVRGDGTAILIEEVYGPDEESVEIELALTENRSGYDFKPYKPDVFDEDIESVAPSGSYSKIIATELPEGVIVMFSGRNLEEAAIDIGTYDWASRRNRDTARRPGA